MAMEGSYENAGDILLLRLNSTMPQIPFLTVVLYERWLSFSGFLTLKIVITIMHIAEATINFGQGFFIGMLRYYKRKSIASSGIGSSPQLGQAIHTST